MSGSPAGRLSLLVGIDTESDDQWSLAARQRESGYLLLYAKPECNEHPLCILHSHSRSEAE